MSNSGVFKFWQTDPPGGGEAANPFGDAPRPAPAVEPMPAPAPAAEAEPAAEPEPVGERPSAPAPSDDPFGDAAPNASRAEQVERLAAEREDVETQRDQQAEAEAAAGDR